MLTASAGRLAAARGAAAPGELRHRELAGAQVLVARHCSGAGSMSPRVIVTVSGN